MKGLMPGMELLSMRDIMSDIMDWANLSMPPRRK